MQRFLLFIDLFVFVVRRYMYVYELWCLLFHAGQWKVVCSINTKLNLGRSPPISSVKKIMINTRIVRHIVRDSERPTCTRLQYIIQWQIIIIYSCDIRRESWSDIARILHGKNVRRFLLYDSFSAIIDIHNISSNEKNMENSIKIHKNVDKFQMVISVIQYK